MASSADPKKRFSSRVENYVKYRPGYPVEVLALLKERCGLSPESVVADIGSGTGLLARLFLDLGCRLYGVEPNGEMRAAGEHFLAGYPRFTSVDASAEETGLPDHSMDFVTAGQAFHWFDLSRTRGEFARILKPDGWVVLVWNERRIDTTPFLRAYEQLLLTYGTDYNATNHRHFDEEVIRAFYGGDRMKIESFENIQWFDLQSLRGRLLSSSYVPDAGQPGYEPMLSELDHIFQEYQSGGQVGFAYDTRVYYGQLG
jgi:SAM-dependent methyltransferase